jgi:hypothetical protein
MLLPSQNIQELFTMTKAVFLLPLIAFGIVCGCSGTSRFEGDPLFKEAYQQGCSTGVDFIPGDKSTIHRDAKLYSSNEAYKAGWRAGYSACRINHPQQSNPGIPSEYRGRANGPSGF